MKTDLHAPSTRSRQKMLQRIPQSTDQTARRLLRFFQRALLVAAMLTLPWSVNFADTLALKPDRPDRYVVVKGDTLWDISSKFLEDPWKWPELWKINPEIENPHLIFPGDIIALVFVEGRPVLQLEQSAVRQFDNKGRNIVKLSPKVRTRSQDEAIPPIPLGAIEQFLVKGRVLSQEEVENAPYIVAIEGGRLLSGSHFKAYARGLVPGYQGRYSIYRIGTEYRNLGALRHEVLGIEARMIGEAEVLQYGDPSTLQLFASNREVRQGDRIFPSFSREFKLNFQPHAPDTPVNGTIIGVFDGVSRIGQFQVVVLNRGEEHNVEPGHVLAIMQSGIEVRDPLSQRDHQILLPDERAGLTMVFRTFPRLSYGLVLRASRDIRLFDNVTNP